MRGTHNCFYLYDSTNERLCSIRFEDKSRVITLMCYLMIFIFGKRNESLIVCDFIYYYFSTGYEVICVCVLFLLQGRYVRYYANFSLATFV